MSGRQCHRRLWLETYRRELVELAPATQRVLKSGTELGILARRLMGDGILVEPLFEIEAALGQTSEAIERSGASRKPIYEAAFIHEGVLVRLDALVPTSNGWRIVEVKGSTSVKPYQIEDCAVQAWVTRGAGIEFDSVAVAHINRAFVYPGGGLYEGILTETDVSERIRPLLEQVPAWVKEMEEVLAGPEPDIKTGPQCGDPFACPFFEFCSSKQPAPPEYPVSLLPNERGLAARLMEDGYLDLRQVPLERLKSEVHRRIAEATRTGQPFRSEKAASVIQWLTFPRYYLDFETIAFSIPRWTGTRPFQAMPYQWSCHVQDSTGGVEHREFLDLSGDDPATRFSETLIEALGTEGSILVYNQSFEATRVKELADRLPRLRAPLLALIERMVDLLPLTRETYYHPAMKGSWSIKAVLPAIDPTLDYSLLEDVGDGAEAEQAYIEAIDPATLPERRQAIDAALRRYCSRDTYGLVRLVEHLGS